MTTRLISRGKAVGDVSQLLAHLVQFVSGGFSRLGPSSITLTQPDVRKKLAMAPERMPSVPSPVSIRNTPARRPFSVCGTMSP